MSKETMILLINSATGVYNYHSLILRYPVLVDVGGEVIPIANWLCKQTGFEEETLATLFHPDNEHYCDNIEHFDTSQDTLMVKEGGKGLWDWWAVECIEGDIWAINPEADWDEEKNTWVLGAEE